MSATLKQMTLGEILDRTFQIYWGRFRVFVAISAMPAMLLTALQLADAYGWHLRTKFGPGLSNPFARGLWNALMALALYHVSIVLRSVFLPATLKQGSDCFFGERGSLKGALQFALARWGQFLWIGVLLLFAVMIVPELIAAGLFLGMGTGMNAMGWLTEDRNLPYVVLLVVPSFTGIALFLWTIGWTAFAAPACAFEGVRGFKAMGRSWNLSGGGRWRVAGAWFLILILVTVVNWGVGMAARWCFAVLTDSVRFTALARVGYTGVAWVLYAAVGAIAGPVYPITVTLFYYDQRIRKEGFDIEWMMREAGMTSDAAVAETSATPDAAAAAESATAQSVGPA